VKGAPPQVDRFESKDSIKEIKQDAPPLQKSSGTPQSEVKKAMESN